MELAAAVFTSIAGAFGSGGAAAAGAVGAHAAAHAGAAAAGASIFSGGSLLTGLLQGGLGVLGAIGAAREGEARAAALNAQAQDAEFDAKQEQIEGLSRADRIRRQLLAEKGERDVAYAASGLDLSFGTPAIARRQADEDTSRVLEIERGTTTARRGRYLERAANFRRQAAEARSAGQLRAFGALGESVVRIARRG